MQENNHNDGAEAMQQAFQEFMLGGGNQGGGGTPSSSSKKKKKGRNKPGARSPAQPTTTPSKSPANVEHQRTLQLQKIRKQYWKILNSFQKTLEEDWLGVDDHLGDVIASVVNLRDRIHMSSKHLLRWQQGHSSKSPPEHGFGYRNRSTQPNAVLGHLTSDDLELALSHDLIKHEKMLAGTRRLLSSLNQAQEALGRRLDELLKYHLETDRMLTGNEFEDGEDLALFAAQTVDWCRQVYAELAQELYRKQGLIQTLLDSVTDNLLYQEDDELLLEDGEDDATPIKVAENCHRLWPRGSSDSDGSGSYLKDLLALTPWN